MLFSDLAVYMMARNYGLEQKLIYNASTYLTNTEDVNDYLKLGDSLIVSADLSLEEQLRIVSRASKPVIVFAFGKYAIFHSKRELLTNYLKYRKNNKVTVRNNKNYTIVEEFRNEHYPIMEDENGTHVFTPKYYCLLKELPQFLKEKLEGIYLSTNFLKPEQIEKLMSVYSRALLDPSKADELYAELEPSIPDLGEGLRNRKTVLTKEETL
jgi:putative protease